MNGENFLMGLAALVVFGFLAVLGIQRFLPKTFKSGKFILEDICKWKDVIDLLKNLRIRKLLWITFGFLVIITVAKYIPLPGLNYKALTSTFGEVGIRYFSSTLRHMSIFALGIMPFLSANCLLLLLSIAIPKIRRYSQSTVNSNKIITRWIYFITVALCIIQAHGISTMLSNPANFQGTVIVPNPGASFRITVIVFMTLGTIIMLLIASGINKFGIGQGISLIVTLGMCIVLTDRICSIIHRQALLHGQNFNLILFLFIHVVALILGFWLLRIKRTLIIENGDNREKASTSLSINQSGIIPTALASSLIMLPATLMRFTNSSLLNKYADVFCPGHPLYYIIYLVLVIPFSLGYGKIAFNPKYTGMRLKQNNLKIIDEEAGNEEGILQHMLFKLNLIWAGVLIIYFVLLDILSQLFHTPYISKIAFLVIPAVILGCLQTILRKNHNLKEVYSHTELGEIWVAKSYLETNGVKAYIDNVEAYGRLYCYFIGLLATKKLFVNAQDYERASDLIEEYKIQKL